MGRLAKWYYNCELPSQSACRVILIAVSLSIIHSVGILISVYYLLTRIIEADKTEKPFHHVCTSAILCPFYRILKGIAGISVQLGGSILGLIINLTLLLGVFHSASWALLLWLFCYVFAIVGCLSLFAVIIRVLAVRDEEENDVDTGTYFVSLIPLLLGIVYILCWILVFRVWRRMRLRDSQIYVCVD